MISPVRSGWPTMLPRTWNRSPMAACISPLPHPHSRAIRVPADMPTVCHITMASIYLDADRRYPALRGAQRAGVAVPRLDPAGLLTFALRGGGLARFVAGLGCLLGRAGRMAAGLKHQDDPDGQQDHEDESHERDCVQ